MFMDLIKYITENVKSENIDDFKNGKLKTNLVLYFNEDIIQLAVREQNKFQNAQRLVGGFWFIEPTNGTYNNSEDLIIYSEEQIYKINDFFFSLLESLLKVEFEERIDP